MPAGKVKVRARARDAPNDISFWSTGSLDLSFFFVFLRCSRWGPVFVSPLVRLFFFAVQDTATQDSPLPAINAQATTTNKGEKGGTKDMKRTSKERTITFASSCFLCQELVLLLLLHLWNRSKKERKKDGVGSRAEKKEPFLHSTRRKEHFFCI